jgi:hypothetical protein
MAMGIVSDSDFDSELDSLNKNPSDAKPSPDTTTIPTAEVVDVSKGRGSNPEVPNSLRKLIGEEAVTNGRQAALDLAKTFNLSPSSVSAYAVGATSTATIDERPNEPHIAGIRGKITRKAFSTLHKAIKHITEDKLQATSAKELAGIAKDMSAVVRTMEPDNKQPTNVNNGPTFVFYSPQQRREDSFDVVFAKE